MAVYDIVTNLQTFAGSIAMTLRGGRGIWTVNEMAPGMLLPHYSLKYLTYQVSKTKHSWIILVDRIS
jgi:hypothetical protein